MRRNTRQRDNPLLPFRHIIDLGTTELFIPGPKYSGMLSFKNAAKLKASDPNSQMTIEIFDQSIDVRASKRFEEWRRANAKRGYYLNENADFGWVLHRARCGRVPHADEANIAGRVKVCSTDRIALRTWVRERGCADAKCCWTCKPNPIPPRYKG